MERALAGQPIEQFPVPSEIQDKEGSKKKN
jgi:hypothetical protein